MEKLKKVRNFGGEAALWRVSKFQIRIQRPKIHIEPSRKILSGLFPEKRPFDWTISCYPIIIASNLCTSVYIFLFLYLVIWLFMFNGSRKRPYDFHEIWNIVGL